MNLNESSPIAKQLRSQRHQKNSALWLEATVARRQGDIPDSQRFTRVGSSTNSFNTVAESLAVYGKPSKPSLFRPAKGSKVVRPPKSKAMREDQAQESRHIFDWTAKVVEPFAVKQLGSRVAVADVEIAGDSRLLNMLVFGKLVVFSRSVRHNARFTDSRDNKRYAVTRAVAEVQRMLGVTAGNDILAVWLNDEKAVITAEPEKSFDEQGIITEVIPSEPKHDRTGYGAEELRQYRNWQPSRRIA
jgi:hypothetical protein